MDKNKRGKPQFSGTRVKVPLGSLGKVVTGNTPSKKDERYWAAEDVPFIKPGDIDESAVTYLADGTEYIADCAIGKARCVGAGAVLVTCIGTIAKIAVVNCNCIAFNQQINAIDVDRNVVDPQYLAYALKANNTRLKMLANAPVVPIINKRQFESFVLLIHSDLNVQREIVSQFTAIGSQRQKLDEELCYLDDLVKSRFVEMFGDLITNDRGWGFVKLSNVCDVRDGTHASPRYCDRGYPLMTSKNFSQGIVDYSGAKLISFEDYSEINRRSKVDAGDIVMPMIGTIGHPVIIDSGHEFAIKNVALLKTSTSRINKVFLKALLESDYFTHISESENKGATQKFISLGSIRNLMIPDASLNLQQKFAAFVQQVDKLRFKTQQQIEKLEMLKKSLMQEYFG